ncbi:MAG TPA: FtsQ-type POTRA domain-containing protein [Pseudacidobacterium sp.]|nr:FtsQ-type POTRA domain-containing protein [Pseudacidobacterium sp.]
MAKISSYQNGPATAENELPDEFLRPAAKSRTRPPRPLPREEEDGSDEEVFLRARKRVSVRKGFLPPFLTRTPIGRAVLGIAALAFVALCITAVLAIRNFLDHDPRFRVESASAIQIDGNSQLTRRELLTVFGGDIGRNLFFVPLSERRKQLEQLPWVAHATVMRVLPNQLRVAIVERTPVAFARIGNQVKLVDADGVILDMAPAALAAKHYSFPVVIGINPDDPLSVRGPRMRIYQKFMNEIDTGIEKVSQQMSEIDISDPEDLQGLVSENGSDILLHFGQDNFLNRWNEYKSHLAEWKQQYPNLASVDLRYDRQVVLKMTKDADTNQAQNQSTALAPQQSATKPAAKAQPITHPHRKRA